MGIHLDFWQKTSWFAIQSKSRQEDLAAARVAELDLKIFLPQVREKQSVHGGGRRVTKALFPGYFFARFCPLESMDAVRYTHGVLRVVGSGGFRFPWRLRSFLVSGSRSNPMASFGSKRGASDRVTK